MRLLALPDFVKEALAKNELSEGHARQILALATAGGDEIAQRKLFDFIVKENWSVRKAEQFVIGFKKNKTDGQPVRERLARRATLTETALTKSIAKRIGLGRNSVRQKITGHGGEIVIKFADETELLKIRAIFAKK